ncbi:hypothetical protein HN682_08015 [Candidatus Peregrinibacteria bacterium]|jgi:hypothetical protein|nr:hypothetical protein [Candidatus Peregrinibacteria bacterium]
METSIDPGEWEQFVNPDPSYDPEKIQLVIDAQTLKPKSEGEVPDIMIMQDGVYMTKPLEGFKVGMVRLYVNCQLEKVLGDPRRIMHDLPNG